MRGPAAAGLPSAIAVDHSRAARLHAHAFTQLPRVHVQLYRFLLRTA